MLAKVVKICLICLSLTFVAADALAKAPVLKNLTFESDNQKTEIVFSFDQPTKMIFYTIGNPPQIIADIVGDAMAVSSNIAMDMPINYGQIKSVRAFRETSLQDEHLYGVDFFIIDLKQKVAYVAFEGDNSYTLYIANSQDITLSQIKPKTEEPEPVTQEIEIEEIEEPKPEAEVIKEKKKKEPPKKEKRVAKKRTKLTEKKRGIEFKVKDEVPEKTDTQLAKQWRQIGYNHQMVEERNKAIESYLRAISYDPNYACVHNDLGIVYYYEGQVEQAIKEFKEAIRIDPKYLGAYTNLALIYEQMGETQKALGYWQKRAELADVNDPWAKKAKEKVKDLKR